MATKTVESAIKDYLTLRDARHEIKVKYEKEDAAIKAKMEKIEQWLLNQTNKLGVDSLGCELGTAFRKEEVKPVIEDDMALFQHVLESKNPTVYQRRISSTYVKEYIAEHKAPPPGVGITREYVIQVRRK